MSPRSLKTKGFTLIELLVVIAIISLLSSIILAAVTQARRKADEAFVLSSVHQLQNAIEIYKSYTGNYPGDSNALFHGSGGPGFWPSTQSTTYSAFCAGLDDFHCVMNYFLVNSTPKLVPTVFGLPTSFAVTDSISYYIPNPLTDLHTFSCNGVPSPNYIIFISASDHLPLISNMPMTYSSGSVPSGIGCIGG